MGVFREKAPFYGEEWRTWVVISSWLVGALFIVVLLFFGGRTIGHTIDTAKCDAQAQYFPDRNVVFVDWNYVDWDCLVETDSGIFVEIGKYRATVEGD